MCERNSHGGMHAFTYNLISYMIISLHVCGCVKLMYEECMLLHQLQKSECCILFTTFNSGNYWFMSQLYIHIIGLCHNTRKYLSFGMLVLLPIVRYAFLLSLWLIRYIYLFDFVGEEESALDYLRRQTLSCLRPLHQDLESHL